ncbi:carbon starvation protein A [Clostridium sp. cel8]|uniref:carbon starvation CstA family protein n=1 Tax=Clostridium sp. cel8 TaxID=2663123 RepID=UPI0015F40E5E|nr:carbon starvation protein A [Clostridium sp. cel8]MBA5851858.1 carbon starvation protein A [Clostridium sp. cel8]
MYTFLGGLVILLSGFLFYSKYVEKQFGADGSRITPAYASEDGVDYVQMPSWKLYFIQFLNIAGLGPIFGAIQGALYGPVAFLWVIIGCVFGGAVHDYISGMISVRKNGAGLSEIHGEYLGKSVQRFMRVLTVFFSMIVGIVFIVGPAKLLSQLIPVNFGVNFWVFAIIFYYFLATMLPINAIIGKIYPIFGACLLFMAIGVGGAMLFQGYNIPEVNFINLHPSKLAMWPMMFVTIACGAVSGFHATQSPLVARCLRNEKEGRTVFYGAMISEGVVALVWVAAGLAFYGNTTNLGQIVLGKAGPAGAVFEITKSLLGPIGSVIAIIGIVVCPITTGDTAFRSARILLAEMFKYPQGKIKNRLTLAIPMFVIAIFFTFVDFPILWRYMSFLTQAFAMVTLWACSVYLYKNSKNHWITTLPAIFMSAVSVSYILQAQEGFRLNPTFSNVTGVVVSVAFFVLFYVKMKYYSNASSSDTVKESAI